MWIPGNTLTTQNSITEEKLTRYIQQGKIIAYDKNKFLADKNSYKPINWQKLEADFKEIQELSQTLGKTTILKNQSYDADPLFPGRRKGYQKVKKEVDRHRIYAYPDTYKDHQGIERRTPPVPLPQLLINLRKERVQTIIPQSQADEIGEGWGTTQILPIALKAIYLAEEVERVTAKETNREKTFFDLAREITKDMYPKEMSDNEQRGLSKTISMLKGDQFPKAFSFCSRLLLPHLESSKIDHIRFTEKDIVEMAKKEGISSTIAKDIHKSLLPAWKGKKGRPKAQK